MTRCWAVLIAFLARLDARGEAMADIIANSGHPSLLIRINEPKLDQEHLDVGTIRVHIEKDQSNAGTLNAAH